MTNEVIKAMQGKKEHKARKRFIFFQMFNI